MKSIILTLSSSIVVSSASLLPPLTSSSSSSAFDYKFDPEAIAVAAVNQNEGELGYSNACTMISFQTLVPIIKEYVAIAPFAPAHNLLKNRGFSFPPG